MSIYLIIAIIAIALFGWRVAHSIRLDGYGRNRPPRSHYPDL